MCSGKEHPDTAAFIANIRQPGISVPRKAWMILVNALRKVVRLKSCCGHPGEPGC
jgi:hypothetical protein